MPLSAFVLGTIFSRWLDDGEATMSAIIAFFGGGYVVHRFRAVPRGRERQTIEAMQSTWKTLGAARGDLLRTFPALLRDGREAVLAAAAVPGSGCPPALREQLDRWSQPTGTAAHEILEDEAKLRSLLWAVLRVEEARAGSQAIAGLSAERVEAMRDHVTKINDFAQLVELDLFEQSDVLGLLHRSIGPICKAAEPVIWAANADEGRWGLRVMRLRLRVEHFNDVTPIHRVSELQWTNPRMSSPLVYHAALFDGRVDPPAPTARLRHMGARERAELRLETLLARYRRRFGGARLRRHTATENRLAGQLRFAIEHDRDPLRFDWSLETLELDERHATAAIGQTA